MWITIKMNSGSIREGTVVEAYGYEAERGEAVEVTRLIDVNGNIQETEYIGRDSKTKKLHITYVRHRENSLLGDPQIQPGEAFTFGRKLPEGIKSPWPYEQGRLFVDVYQFPDGEYRLVSTNLSGYYPGQHVRVELGHATRGDETMPCRDVYLEGICQFQGRFGQQKGNLIRIVKLL